MTGKTTGVLVLMGGPDAEREVSLMSGEAVSAALRALGRYRVVDHAIGIIDADTLSDLARCERIDVVFPVLHGRWGEGGPLQEILEAVGLPYVGSGPRAAALAMDKLATKMLLAAEGVPTPPARQLLADEECDLAPPLVLKPIDDGSSVDMRICHSAAKVARARATLHPKRDRLMAERYIDGREFTVGIVCGEPMPVIEIIPADAVEFYDYQAKYERDDTRYIIDPEAPPDLKRRCQDLAMLAFRRLGCRDLARVDFMIDEQGPWFLELNTIPGFTGHSLVPMAARTRGMEMPDLCAALVHAALARGVTGRKPGQLESAAASVPVMPDVPARRS